MIALQIAVDVLMDMTIVHSRASGEPRASHCMRSLGFCRMSLPVSVVLVFDLCRCH